MVYSEGDLPTVFMGLGIIFACILLPASLLLSNPQQGPAAAAATATKAFESDDADAQVREYLMSQEFTCMWVFSVLVCYLLLCFGGGFATMPSFIVDVFGSRRMSTIYGAILTAWAAAGIIGPLYVGYLKDQYPNRAVTYCFLIGVLMLGVGYVFTYLLNDDRILLRRPTVEGTLRYFDIPVPRA